MKSTEPIKYGHGLHPVQWRTRPKLSHKIFQTSRILLPIVSWQGKNKGKIRQERSEEKVAKQGIQLLIKKIKEMKRGNNTKLKHIKKEMLAKKKFCNFTRLWTQPKWPNVQIIHRPVSSQTRPDSLSFNKSNKILNCPQNAFKKHKKTRQDTQESQVISFGVQLSHSSE